MSSTKPRGTNIDQKALLTRLKRIEGQVKGIQGMITQERYCIDVLTQIAACKAALNSVALQLLENHTQTCVQNAIQEKNGHQSIQELMLIIKKLT